MNFRALRGEDYNDEQFAADMSKRGINIPTDILQTKKMNSFVIDKMYDLNKAGLQDKINPDTGLRYTAKEADMQAMKDKERAIKVGKGLKGI